MSNGDVGNGNGDNGDNGDVNDEANGTQKTNFQRPASLGSREQQKTVLQISIALKASELSCIGPIEEKRPHIF